MGKFASRDSTGTPVAWGDITGKPSTFDPNPHDNAAHSTAYAPTANPTFTGVITHSHATYGDIKIGHNTSGAYIEQDGNSTAYENLRLQSSVGGDATNYIQFIVDPTSGFSFGKIGTGNNYVGFGGNAAPVFPITLASQTAIGWEYNANAASRRWKIENDVLEFGDIAIMTQSSKVGAVDVKRIVISAAGEVTVNGNGIITGSLMVYSS